MIQKADIPVLPLMPATSPGASGLILTCSGGKRGSTQFLQHIVWFSTFAERPTTPGVRVKTWKAPPSGVGWHWRILRSPKLPEILVLLVHELLCEMCWFLITRWQTLQRQVQYFNRHHSMPIRSPGFVAREIQVQILPGSFPAWIS